MKSLNPELIFPFAYSDSAKPKSIAPAPYNRCGPPIVMGKIQTQKIIQYRYLTYKKCLSVSLSAINDALYLPPRALVERVPDHRSTTRAYTYINTCLAAASPRCSLASAVSTRKPGVITHFATMTVKQH